MSSENKKSDAEEVLEEFQKTHEINNPQVEQSKLEPQQEPPQEPQQEPPQEPQQEPPQNKHGEKSVENNMTIKFEDMIFVGTKPIMTYVTAALTRLSSLSIVTIKARGRRITQAIDVSQMIVKRMNEVGFTINDVRILSESLISRDGQKRIVSTIEIDVKNTSIN